MAPGKPKLVGGSPEGLPSSSEQAGVDGQSTDSVLGPAPAPWIEQYKLSYLTLLLLTAGAIYAAYIIFRPYLKALFLAMVLTIAFLPVHEWVARRVRGRTLSALVTTAAVVLVVMVPLTFIGVSLFSQAASLYGFVSQQMGGPWSGHFTWATEALQRTADQIGMPPQQLRSVITTRVQEFGGWLVGMAGWAARGVMQQMFTAILTFLVLFFFLRDRETYVGYIANLLPLPPGRARQLASALHDTVVGNLYGMVAVALIQGFLTTIGWWMAGLPAPLFWGAIATLFSFVPLVGPSLVWIPGALVLALQGRWIPAIALCIWGGVVVSAVDYIVRPRFAAGRANANTLLVLLSLLGGLRAFGAIGIIAGPVVLSAVTALLSMMREERSNVYR
jgi:predicted PurR-regulated permease PerM